jgi:hypothetical protein
MKINSRKFYLMLLLCASGAGSLMDAVQDGGSRAGGRSMRPGKSRLGRRSGYRRNFAPVVYGAYMPYAYESAEAYSPEDFTPSMPSEGVTTHISTSSEYGPGFAKIMTTTT